MSKNPTSILASFATMKSLVDQLEKVVLDRFETFVTPIFDGVCQMVQENKNLIKQRDLLLKRMMSGKLEV